MNFKSTRLLLITAIISCSIPHATFAAPLAQCQVFMPAVEWNYEGYVINLAGLIGQTLQAKNYSVTQDQTQAQYVLDLDVVAQNERIFQHAVSKYEWKPVAGAQGSRLNGRFNKRCLTALCSIYDFGPPIEKMMAELQKKIPQCN